MRSEKVNSSNLLTFAKCFKKLKPLRLDGETVLLCSLVKYHTKGDGTQFFHDPELLPQMWCECAQKQRIPRVCYEEPTR